MLIAIGLLGLFAGSSPGGIWFAFLGWFLVQAAQSEVAMASVRQALAGAKVSDLMSPDPVVVRPDLSVAELLESPPPGRRFSSYPVVDGGRLVGLVTLRTAAALPRPEQPARRVADVMTPVGEAATVAADSDAVDVLPLLDGVTTRAMVTDGGRLVGVLSGSDVVRAIESGAAAPAPEPARRTGVAVWVFVGLVMLVAGAALYHPGYVVIAPGDATDVSTDVTIDGIPVTPVNGSYLLTSVSVSQPSALRVLLAAMRPDRDVLRLSDLVPRGVEPDEYVDRQRAIFRESQMLAAAAAARSQGLDVAVTGTGVRVVQVADGSPADPVLRAGDVILAVDGQPVTEAAALVRIVSSRPAGTQFRIDMERGGERIERVATSAPLPQLAGGVGLGITIETRGLDVDLPFEISFAERRVGGPSAGVAYAAAIADMLSARDYARGRTIAATGTIDAEGDVGPVGGVEQKAVAAGDAGAELFLVPAGEVHEAGDAGLRVHGVQSLGQALDVLAAA